MNPEDRTQLSDRLTAAAKKSATAARTATGWRKWLYIAAAIAAAGSALFLSTSCAAAYTQTPGNISAAVRILPLTPNEYK